jgi:hypothetical protein
MSDEEDVSSPLVSADDHRSYLDSYSRFPTKDGMLPCVCLGECDVGVGVCVGVGVGGTHKKRTVYQKTLVPNSYASLSLSLLNSLSLELS